MKRILYGILLIVLLFLPTGILAEGYVSVSPSSLTIEQGSSKTFTITAYNAIGDVTIKSNNTSIAKVNTSEWGTGMVDEKQKKTGTIRVTGVNVGTAKITLTIDAATFDAEDLSGQTKTITVNVIPKTTPKPSNPTTPDPKPTLSTNNKLKSLTVEGHNLVKVDDHNYTLTVGSDVTSIQVMATAEDSKAKVRGTGAQTLVVGENNFEVVITSESGLENKIKIKVTRKDGYYLEDLDSLLKQDQMQNIDILIGADTVISSEIVSSIQQSSKIVTFHYYDSTKKLVYSWTLDGKKITNATMFLTTVLYTSEYDDEIEKLSNYADGLIIDFKHNGALPIGTKIRLYVGDKFENDDIVKVYHYDSAKKAMEFILGDLKVSEGYIEFAIEHCSQYFVTMANLGVTAPIKEKEPTSSTDMIMIIAIVEFFLIVILSIACAVFFIRSQRGSKADTEMDEASNTGTDNGENMMAVMPVRSTSMNHVEEVAQVGVNPISTAYPPIENLGSETLNTNVMPLPNVTNPSMDALLAVEPMESQIQAPSVMSSELDNPVLDKSVIAESVDTANITNIATTSINDAVTGEVTLESSNPNVESMGMEGLQLNNVMTAENGAAPTNVVPLDSPVNESPTDNIAAPMNDVPDPNIVNIDSLTSDMSKKQL